MNPTNCRPGHFPIERLENRIAPATFIVASLADSGLGSLREAVLAAEATPQADTIVFKAGLAGTIVLSDGEIEISTPLTIKGPGAGKITIDGNASSRIFEVHDGNTGADAPFSVSGLSLLNGNTEGDGTGGAIASTESLTVKGCVISGNIADSGGAISVSGSASTKVTISGCVISGNIATGGGGGIELNAGKGISITNSFVLGNSAETGGGAALALGAGADAKAKIAITGSTFRSNTAAAEGGGISAEDSISIVKSEISGNTAGPTGGGGLFLDGAVLTMTSSRVHGNRTLGDEDANGAGMHLHDSSATLTKTNFYGNAAGDLLQSAVFSGGAIYYDGAGDATNFLKINGGTISGNVANYLGGGITGLGGGTITIKAVSFIANRAIDLGRGGAISIFDDGAGETKLEIQGGFYEGNSAETGGALDLAAAGNVSIKGAKFVSNRAIRQVSFDNATGGAIAASGNTITVSGCLFNLNTSDDFGGAITIDGTNNFTLTGCTIINNAAESSGGGLWAGTGKLSISKTKIVGNQTMGSGGGLAVFDAVTAIATTIVTGNIASSEGGLSFDDGNPPNLAPTAIIVGNIALVNPNSGSPVI